MSKFIEVNDIEYKERVLINVNKIIYVCQRGDTRALIRYANSEEPWAIIETEESYDEICERIKSGEDVNKVIKQLKELEKEHPYKVIGQPDTYSQYNEAWRDCMDRVLSIVKRGGAE